MVSLRDDCKMLDKHWESCIIFAGAALTVGGEAPPFPGGVLLAPLKGGVMHMEITLSELFQFCMVIIGIIGLVLQAKKK